MTPRPRPHTPKNMTEALLAQKTLRNEALSDKEKEQLIEESDALLQDITNFKTKCESSEEEKDQMITEKDLRIKELEAQNEKLDGEIDELKQMFKDKLKKFKDALQQKEA